MKINYNDFYCFCQVLMLALQKNIRDAANPLATPRLKRTSLLYAFAFTLSSFKGGFCKFIFIPNNLRIKGVDKMLFPLYNISVLRFD